MIRTRFAPSPTGFLHIGGVRTALFNFLYARNQGGVFLLRIEDTDRERSEKKFEENILYSLKWLGLNWDGALIRQSERLEKYRQYASMLLEKGLAYEEKLDQKTAVKFRIPKEGPGTTVKFHDLVRGEVVFDASLFEDIVIIKSDGYPTYQFACVVDDYEMEITHVIRGEDHISNTPRQILLYQALGWKPPKFAHLPLILGADGTPLSKRHGSVSLPAYQEEGFIPEGILNYLALLGWGSDDNQEIFTLADLLKKFSMKRITKAGARFNREKLEWVNGEHLKRLSDEDFVARLSGFCPEDAKKYSPALWKQFVLLYKTRLKTLKDLKTQADYFFADRLDYEAKTKDSFTADSKALKLLADWVRAVQQDADFSDLARLERLTREVAEKAGAQAKEIIHPLRFVLTGKTVSPGLFEVMNILGKEKCLSRVNAFAK